MEIPSDWEEIQIAEVQDSVFSSESYGSSDLRWMFPVASTVTEKLPLDGDLKHVFVQQELAVFPTWENITKY